MRMIDLIQSIEGEYRIICWNQDTGASLWIDFCGHRFPIVPKAMTGEAYRRNRSLCSMPKWLTDKRSEKTMAVAVITERPRDDLPLGLFRGDRANSIHGTWVTLGWLSSDRHVYTKTSRPGKKNKNWTFFFFFFSWKKAWKNTVLWRHGEPTWQAMMSDTKRKTLENSYKKGKTITWLRRSWLSPCRRTGRRDRNAPPVLHRCNSSSRQESWCASDGTSSQHQGEWTRHIIKKWGQISQTRGRKLLD